MMPGLHGLKPFHGLPYEDLDSFIETMEQARYMFQWTETELLACANLQLVGPAGEWLDQMDQNFQNSKTNTNDVVSGLAASSNKVNGWSSWAQFKEALYHRFSRNTNFYSQHGASVSAFTSPTLTTTTSLNGSSNNNNNNNNNSNNNNTGIGDIDGITSLRQEDNESLQSWIERVNHGVNLTTIIHNTSGFNIDDGSYDNLKTSIFMKGLDPNLSVLFPTGMVWNQIVGQVELMAQSPDLNAIIGSSRFSCSNRGLVRFLVHTILDDIPLCPISSPGGDGGSAPASPSCSATESHDGSAPTPTAGYMNGEGSNDIDGSNNNKKSIPSNDVAIVMERLERLQARFGGISKNQGSGNTNYNNSGGGLNGRSPVSNRGNRSMTINNSPGNNNNNSHSSNSNSNSGSSAGTGGKNSMRSSLGRRNTMGSAASIFSSINVSQNNHSGSNFSSLPSSSAINTAANQSHGNGRGGGSYKHHHTSNNKRHHQQQPCPRCDHYGHDQVSCPNRPRICYQCRKSGHVAADCPEASGDENDAVELAIDPENLKESVLHSLCQFVKTCPRQPWVKEDSKEDSNGTKKKPWDTIGLGIIGPFTETKKGNRFIIFAIDSYLDTPEIRAIPNTSKEVAMEFFVEQILACHGCPRRIASQHRTEFRTTFWDYLTQRLNVERMDSCKKIDFRKILKGMVKRLDQTFGDEWDRWLDEVAIAYRTTEYHEVKVYIPNHKGRGNGYDDDDEEDEDSGPEIKEGDFVWLGMDGPYTVISIEGGDNEVIGEEKRYHLMDMFGKDMGGSYSRKEIKLYGTQ